MPQRRELRSFDVDLPESLGVADFEMFIGKTFYVLGGIMYPQDETSFNVGRNALKALGSLTIEQADTGADMGYVPYAWTELTANGLVNKHINMKVLYSDVPESTRNGLKQPFTLYCKIKDPAIFGDAVTFSIGNNTSVTTGSSGLSFGLPHGLGSSTNSSGGSTVNPGNMPAWGNFTIYGPVTNPVITNNTTGKSMRVNVVLPTTSDSININWTSDSNTITQAGNSIMSLLTSTSSWLTLVPGTNNLTFSSDSIGSGAYATCTYNPQWSLS
jgi:hypothetical protein